MRPDGKTARFASSAHKAMHVNAVALDGSFEDSLLPFDKLSVLHVEAPSKVRPGLHKPCQCFLQWTLLREGLTWKGRAI
eukprot:955515-Amphidinium_carterae.1